MAKCTVCFRECEIPEGTRGFCGVRAVRDGTVVPLNYGHVTSLALDPIEKKPLARFFPGSVILSAGSWGCNLRCPFCQNYEISWSKEAMALEETAEILTPEDLAATAEYYRKKGNIGVAYTYNEPLVGYEFVRDTAKRVHERGMKNVIVTNGTASLSVLEEILPYIDAMNVDLKGFTDRYYRDVLKGDLETVKAFITRAARDCHVELTCLIVPGENDSREEMEDMCAWIRELKDRDGNRIGEQIPLHVSRFFPRFHMTDRKATDVKTVYQLADTARRYLKYVYTGNC
ncbi:MAG: AmmeMemoRadiSam system radical SAM enzyme [Clostridia bacterium]|nr:AmmeMemoRadiSam system radical SAM enzyme [Clostridia bacterium]